MKKLLTIVLVALATNVSAKDNVVSPSDPHIQYVGRVCFLNPERPRFSYPGTQINVAFQGTTLRMKCKPGSGYFMAQIDKAEPFKIAFRGERDSVVTLCTALPEGRHTARLMYCNEGYEYKPEFRGFLTDGQLTDMDALPAKKFEFIGNSITCGYGNEGRLGEPFLFETENHYYGYAQLTMRRLGTVASIIAATMLAPRPGRRITICPVSTNIPSTTTRQSAGTSAAGSLTSSASTSVLTTCQQSLTTPDC